MGHCRRVSRALIAAGQETTVYRATDGSRPQRDHTYPIKSHGLVPALILEIVELAEHLNIDFSANYSGFRGELVGRFFNGPRVAGSFKQLLGFESNVRSADADGEMWMPHFYKVRMVEKVLRIEVDGVSIPYKSSYPPLTGHEGKSTENQQSQ